MLIIMDAQATSGQIEHVNNRIKELGYKPRILVIRNIAVGDHECRLAG